MMIAPKVVDYELDFTSLTNRYTTDKIVIHHTGTSDFQGKSEKMVIYTMALIIFFGLGTWVPEIHMFGVDLVPKNVFLGIICTVLFLIEVSSLNENLIELGYHGVSEYVQRIVDGVLDRIAPKKKE